MVCGINGEQPVHKTFTKCMSMPVNFSTCNSKLLATVFPLNIRAGSIRDT